MMLISNKNLKTKKYSDKTKMPLPYLWEIILEKEIMGSFNTRSTHLSLKYPKSSLISWNKVLNYKIQIGMLDCFAYTDLNQFTS